MMRQFSVVVIVSLRLASPAEAQVVSLLVGNNQSGFAGIDRYEAPGGLYAGVFATVPTGSQLSYFRYGGPSSNLFAQQGSNVLQFNGHTGAFINTFSTVPGSRFAFGPDTNMYRLE